jgi:hypothetical protein
MPQAAIILKYVNNKNILAQSDYYALRYLLGPLSIKKFEQ